MKILENQTLYQCSFCHKRLLTKSGCEMHEHDYCKSAGSPNRENCNHEDMGTVYRGSGNEQEPDYDYCLKCGYQE